jgi:hypothetical protein
MRRRRRITFLLVVAGFLLAAPAAWIASVAEAGSFPTWDKKLSGSKRFAKRFDGAAYLDKETGLVWETSPNPVLTAWAGAASGCQITQVGGRLGWRLPATEELSSLIDKSQADPALPPGHPFQNIQNEDYWTASTHFAGANAAVQVNLGTGAATALDKAQQRRRWCVRGGAGVDGGH